MNQVFCVFEEEWNYEGNWIRLQSIHAHETTARSERDRLVVENAEKCLANTASAGLVYYVQTWSVK